MSQAYLFAHDEAVQKGLSQEDVEGNVVDSSNVLFCDDYDKSCFQPCEYCRDTDEASPTVKNPQGPCDCAPFITVPIIFKLMKTAHYFLHKTALVGSEYKQVEERAEIPGLLRG